MSRILLAFVALLVLAAAPVRAQHAAPEKQIQHVMRATWERPDAPLSIEPIVVHESYAVAGWVQDDRGGRALLRQTNGAWEVILCAGDHLRSADTLEAAGVAPAAATVLAASLREAESRLPAARVAKLAQFDQIIRMDDGHGHTPQHRH